jgi:hypothetical protein
MVGCWRTFYSINTAISSQGPTKNYVTRREHGIKKEECKKSEKESC